MSEAGHMLTAGHCPSRCSSYVFSSSHRWKLFFEFNSTLHEIAWNFDIACKSFCNVFSTETQPLCWKCIDEARRCYTKDNRYLLSMGFFVWLTVEQGCAHANIMPARLGRPLSSVNTLLYSLERSACSLCSWSDLSTYCPLQVCPL